LKIIGERISKRAASSHAHHAKVHDWLYRSTNHISRRSSTEPRQFGASRSRLPPTSRCLGSLKLKCASMKHRVLNWILHDVQRTSPSAPPTCEAADSAAASLTVWVRPNRHHLANLVGSPQLPGIDAIYTRGVWYPARASAAWGIAADFLSGDRREMHH
jgi:hypothetical protein